MVNEELQVWTVGHSTHTAEEFDELVSAHAIKTLVDVRSFPGSRRYPQFNQSTLSESLASSKIMYVHAPSLGGRRRPRPDSHNTAWKNPSFRAYADYMESDQFKQGVRELLELAADERTAIMCAESLWWRCHRSLISDYLKAIGIEVNHILGVKKVEPHRYTAAARIVDGQLSYRGLLD
jgi:uncharacterized protein (DUF488 family)